MQSSHSHKLPFQDGRQRDLPGEFLFVAHLPRAPAGEGGTNLEKSGLTVPLPGWSRQPTNQPQLWQQDTTRSLQRRMPCKWNLPTLRKSPAAAHPPPVTGHTRLPQACRLPECIFSC